MVSVAADLYLLTKDDYFSIRHTFEAKDIYAAFEKTYRFATETYRDHIVAITVRSDTDTLSMEL